jgi:hypothetical protein
MAREREYSQRGHLDPAGRDDGVAVGKQLSCQHWAMHSCVEGAEKTKQVTERKDTAGDPVTGTLRTIENNKACGA